MNMQQSASSCISSSIVYCQLYTNMYTNRPGSSGDFTVQAGYVDIVVNTLSLYRDKVHIWIVITSDCDHTPSRAGTPSHGAQKVVDGNEDIVEIAPSLPTAIQAQASPQDVSVSVCNVKKTR